MKPQISTISTELRPPYLPAPVSMDLLDIQDQHLTSQPAPNWTGLRSAPVALISMLGLFKSSHSLVAFTLVVFPECLSLCSLFRIAFILACPSSPSHQSAHPSTFLSSQTRFLPSAPHAQAKHLQPQGNQSNTVATCNTGDKQEIPEIKNPGN